jgi:hypothetical protein
VLAVPKAIRALCGFKVGNDAHRLQAILTVLPVALLHDQSQFRGVCQCGRARCRTRGYCDRVRSGLSAGRDSSAASARTSTAAGRQRDSEN